MDGEMLGSWSRVKLALPELESVKAGEALRFWVYNGGPDRIVVGEGQQLWYDRDGVPELLHPTEAVASIGHIIEPGHSHDFTVRLPDPLRAGKYVVVHTAIRSTSPTRTGEKPLELRASFELSEVSE